MAGTVAVKHFRHRNDDGSESTASWRNSEDLTAFVQLFGDMPTRLRLTLENTVGSLATTQYGLSVSHNGGGFNTVNGASTYVQGRVSGNLVDGANTTEQGTLDPGDTYATQPGVVNVTSVVSNSISLNNNEETEIEFSLVLIAADLNVSDTLDFHIRTVGALVPITQYFSVVRIQIIAPPTEEHAFEISQLPITQIPWLLKLPIQADNNDDSAPLRGTPDEDFRLLVPPWPQVATEYIQLPYEPEPEELPAGVLRGEPDEDFDPRELAMPMALPASLWMRYPYSFEPDAGIVPATAFRPEEEFWQNPVQPISAAQYQWLPAYAFRDLGDLAPGVIPLGPAVAIKAAMSVQQANLWVIARVAGTKPFNLNLLTATIDLSASYVVKQVTSVPLAGVDGATAGYGYQAEMHVPWPCIGQLQIFGASGLAYDADVRFYYKMRHRRR